MTHVVTENCIRCKYLGCVDVCPVDCFYEGENMLLIHDCGVCIVSSQSDMRRYRDGGLNRGWN